MSCKCDLLFFNAICKYKQSHHASTLLTTFGTGQCFCDTPNDIIRKFVNIDDKTINNMKLEIIITATTATTLPPTNKYVHKRQKLHNNEHIKLYYNENILKR